MTPSEAAKLRRDDVIGVVIAERAHIAWCSFASPGDGSGFMAVRLSTNMRDTFYVLAKQMFHTFAEAEDHARRQGVLRALGAPAQ